MLLGMAFAAAQGKSATWELKVCADQDNLPYSNEAEQGFENHIVSAVAAAVHAKVSYVWLPALRNTSQDLLLLSSGACDAFLDIGNGGAPFLPTLDYYQSTYEFFFRADAPFTIASLDDPVLQTLKLGSAAASPAGTAFALRGLVQSTFNYYPTPPTGVTEAMVRDVVDGVIDVAAAWGPEVAYYAAMQPTKLTTVPVTPEIDVNGLSMIYTAAMGLRSNDTDLRDILNQGIADSWDEIQAILQDFGVPIVELPEPATSIAIVRTEGEAPVPSQPEAVRIGVVLPMQTGAEPLGAFTPDVLGGLAFQGATLATEDLASGVEDSGKLLKVLITSAPDMPSTIRAVNRLVGEEGVTAIVGGFDFATALRLSDLAAERGFVFMNIGAQEDALRGSSCSKYAFHVEASSSMYLDALMAYIVAGGARNVFFIRTDESEQVARMNRVNEDLAAGVMGDGIVINSYVVHPREPNFTGAIEAIRDASPDLVVMLLDTQSELIMLGQYETAGVDSAIIGYPEGASQIRLFYATSSFESPVSGSGNHFSLWEGSFDQGEAADLNQRFLGRFGQPMDPPAWSAYVAVKLLTEAAVATGTVNAADWITYLEASDTVIDVFKGQGTSFRYWDHQLRQPVYVVGINPDYTDKKAYRDIAEVVYEIPSASSSTRELDALGVSSQSTTCDLQ